MEQDHLRIKQSSLTATFGDASVKETARNPHRTAHWSKPYASPASQGAPLAHLPCAKQASSQIGAGRERSDARESGIRHAIRCKQTLSTHQSNPRMTATDLIHRLRERLTADPFSRDIMGNRFRASPPASPAAVARAEAALGFALPTTLRAIYLDVANGGFGPGYGVMGVEGGSPTTRK